jgi:fumarate reductase flavoprotein subunit
MSARPDLAVVGGGIAGAVAAVRAAELGASVVLLEKGTDTLYRCNTRFTGGAFHIAFHDIDEAPEPLAALIQDVTQGFADERIGRAVAHDARHAVRWLRAQGIRMIRAGPDAWRQHFLAPPGLMKTGLHWEGRGGDVMLRTLRQRLESLGGRLVQGGSAKQLLMQSGRCTGIVFEANAESRTLEAGNVMLCDGGFQGNLELLRRYVSPAPEKVKQRGAATGMGDALRMAVEVGAATVGLETIYGHLLCQDALNSDRLWPYPIMDLVAGASVVVDRSGRRFMDEGLGGVYMTNGIARLADPLSATVVFDEAIWQGPATTFILPANPHLVLAGGTIHSADTLSDLATRIGVPGDALERTVREYNDAVSRDATAGLSPARTASTTSPHRIATPPFHAVRLAAGITFTMGGIVTDDVGHVLDAERRLIPGLFASGCCTGGLEGGRAAGYVSGLTKSATISWRAAQEIVQPGVPP